jgi:zinc-ribbon domain
VVNSASGDFVMQHCEECGAELPTTAVFCGHCGRKITSDSKIATNVNSAPIENRSIPQSDLSTPANDSQDSTLVNGEDEKQEKTELPAENDAEDEQSQSTQTATASQEMQSPYASAQKPKSRRVSRCLLFSLFGLIIIVGVVVAVMGLFHRNVPGFSGSSKAESSSTVNEIINPTGSSLTASICVNTSTPSTSATNSGSTFTLTSSSGCSTVIASKADSSCLIFPNTTAASHKFIVDVSNAAIDSNSYHLVLGIVDYTGPTTYNDARHISVGFSQGATGRTFSWLYHSGSVTVNSNEQSGIMDVILKAVSGGNTLHIVGNWVCGRQMKST